MRRGDLIGSVEGCVPLLGCKRPPGYGGACWYGGSGGACPSAKQVAAAGTHQLRCRRYDTASFLYCVTGVFVPRFVEDASRYIFMWGAPLRRLALVSSRWGSSRASLPDVDLGVVHGLPEVWPAGFSHDVGCIGLRVGTTPMFPVRGSAASRFGKSHGHFTHGHARSFSVLVFRISSCLSRHLSLSLFRARSLTLYCSGRRCQRAVHRRVDHLRADPRRESLPCYSAMTCRRRAVVQWHFPRSAAITSASSLAVVE